MYFQAISALVNLLKWQYVALVYTEEAYGTEGAALLTKLLKTKGVCIAEEIGIPLQHEWSTPYTVMSDLVALSRTANGMLGVIYIGQFDVAKSLFMQAKNMDSSNRLLWILSDGVGRCPLENCNQPMLTNALFITPYTSEEDTFKSHWVNLLHKHIHDNSSLPDMIREHIETTYHCSFINSDSKYCKDLTVSDLENGYTHSDHIDAHIDAVLLYAQTIKALRTQKCSSEDGLCPAMMGELQETLYAHMLNMSLTYPGEFQFTPELENIIRPQNGRTVNLNDSTGDLALDPKYPTFQAKKYICDAGNPACEPIRVSLKFQLGCIKLW